MFSIIVFIVENDRKEIEMSIEYAIRTHGLTKRYGVQNAVDALDMSVPRGSIYGFVGRNGAGKSTTMRMLAGLADPTEGQISLFGKPAASYTAPIGALIESPGVLPNLSAIDNLMVKALAIGIPDAHTQCLELVELVGLASAGRKKARAFSLGMRQRLGLALALVGAPDILLLDEPLNGLDPEGSRAMRTLLIRLRDEREVTILISSHVLDQLNRVADRFGVISEGRMVAEFTDEQMQDACGEFVHVNTADNTRAHALLEQALPQARFRVGHDGSIDVSGTRDSQTIAQIIQDQGIALLELSIVRRDIEDYFLEIMAKGETHA